VLISRLDGFERFAHLEYAPMPGGDAAVREPWRMALGALRTAGLDVGSSEILKLLGARENEVRVLERMIERGVNSPLTSSCGRLFDAAAALILGRRPPRRMEYEAQAAIELEGLAVDEADDASGYPIAFIEGDWDGRVPAVLSSTLLWRELLNDLAGGVSKGRISARFHAGVAEGFTKATVMARTATGLAKVAMSGGCMHNRRLARLLRPKLEAEAFEVFQHVHVSPGDGGLSYGQAVIAAATLNKSKLAGETH
jgi:hydrogenase maturation protein HypF